MVHPYTMFSRRCYWYVLVMDVHDVSAPPRHGHLVAAPLPSVLNAPMEKREFLDEHGLTTQQFWQKSRNLQKIYGNIYYITMNVLGIFMPFIQGRCGLTRTGDLNISDPWRGTLTILFGSPKSGNSWRTFRQFLVCPFNSTPHTKEKKILILILIAISHPMLEWREDMSEE